MSMSHIPLSEPYRFDDSLFETLMPFYRNVQASTDSPTLLMVVTCSSAMKCRSIMYPVEMKCMHETNTFKYRVSVLWFSSTWKLSGDFFVTCRLYILLRCLAGLAEDIRNAL